METITVATEWTTAGEIPLVVRPWYKKINPIWWFGNDELSAVGNTFWYKYGRNPLQNFRWYVIGMADRVHKVSGRAPICNKRSDLRPVQTGFQWSFVHVFGVPLLPWVCVAYRHFTAYIGWEPRGGFGILLNFSNSDIKDRAAIDASYAAAVTSQGNQS